MSDLQRGFEAWYKSEHELRGETVDLTKRGHMREAYYVGRAHGESELTAAKAEIERLRARVSELEESVTELIQHYSETWDFPILERAESARDGRGHAWLLRRQAEAVEAAVEELPWHGNHVYLKLNDLEEYAQRLRTQAEAAEKGGDDESA